MSIKTALKSIREKGIIQYLEDRQKRKLRRQRRREIALEMEKVLSTADHALREKDVLSEDELLELTMPIARYISENYNTLKKEHKTALEETNNRLFELEKCGKYKVALKAKYIKEIYPEVYSLNASKDVEKKVLVMESGKSPSPSSSHLAKVIRKEGEYEVECIGLMIRKVPMVVFYENGVRFIEKLATAKALFLSTANELLSHFDLRPETKVIQLWHGVGAFKHVGHSTENNAHFGKSKAAWEEYDSFRNYYAVTIAAEGQRWIFKDSMHVSDDQIRPIGVSRTDLFFEKDYGENALEKLYDKFPQIKGKKIILYAPTFRGEVATAKAPDKLDVKMMAEALSDEYVLLIKHHGLSKDIPPIPDGYENSFAFDMNKNNVLGIDKLLMIADVMITDYSSVAFEYAILERPLLFFVYDLEQYTEERGLYFDFEKDAPGPLCRDTESIIDNLLNIEGFDMERLRAFKKEYVEACDGHATERTIALIEE